MERDVNIKVDFSDFSENLNRATDDLEQSVRENLIPVAELLEQKFTQAGESIGLELEKAAKNGTLSMKKLGQSIAFELAKIAVDKLVTKPLEGVFKTVFGGGRANGGFVANKQSYLVGERGPEVFTPAGNGHIVPSHQKNIGSPIINLNVSGISDVQGFQQSEAQIAASLARMLSKSRRVS